MNFKEIKKLFLWLFVGFLVLTALVGIISVLSGEFGEVQFKVLATCLTISAASICSMACAALIEKRNQKALGLSGIALSVVAAALTILGMWPEIDSEEYWKTTFSLAVLAAGTAHAFLLLLPQLDRRHRWVQVVTCVSIATLAVMIIAAAWNEIDDEAYYRVLAVVAIVVVLETLVIPVLLKFRSGEEQRRQQLTLTSLEDGYYADADGRKYEVTPLAQKS